MVFRRKAAVFRPPEPTQIQPNISTIIPQVIQPQPTTIRRVSKAESFVQSVTRPQIIATAPPTRSLIPFQGSPTKRQIGAAQERRISKAQRIAETRRVIPKPIPPRDDLERIEVRGQREFVPLFPTPITPLPIMISETGVPTKLRGDFFQFSKTGKIVPIQEALNKEGKLAKGRVISAQEAAAPRFGSAQAQAQIAREAGVDDPALVPFVSAFQSFTGGAGQEFRNIGSIAGIATARPAAGSLVFGLPFEVGGAVFTKEAPEGKGFAGLGFEFAFEPERGAQVSGEIQRQIVEKFEEDPFRAAGSVVTAGTIEAAIFVGTGGLGRVGLTVAKKFAEVKGRKAAEKIAEKLAEKGVPQFVEHLGGTKFGLVKGTEAAAQRGVVLSPFEAVAVGVKKNISGTLELITAKLPTIRGITLRGKKGKIPPEKAFVKVEPTAKAKVPFTVIDTSAKVAGFKKRQVVVTLFPEKVIKEIGFPTQATIRGVTDPKLLSRLGLEAVGKKATFAEGQLKGGAVRELIIAEEAGATRTVGKGFQFLGSDILENPKTLTNIALTGKTIGGKPAKLSTTLVLESEALGGAKFSVDVAKGRGIFGKKLKGTTFFGSKAEAQELAKFTGIAPEQLIPKGKKVIKIQPTKAGETDIFGTFIGAGGAKVTKGGAGTAAKAGQVLEPRPAQAVDDIAQIFRDVGKASIKQTREFTNIGVPLSLTGFRTGLDFDVTQPIPTKLRSEQINLIKSTQKIIPVLDVDLGTKQGKLQGEALDFFVPTKQRQVTRSLLDEDLIRTPEFKFAADERFDFGFIVGQRFQPFTPIVPVTRTRLKPPITTTRIRPTGFFPFLPPFEEERRRKRAKTKKSRLGGRLFDIATEPFGEVEVGLGFFIEQTRPEQTIAEAIGLGEEPITRQERQARERLSKRRRPRGFAEEFGLGDFFS